VPIGGGIYRVGGTASPIAEARPSVLSKIMPTPYFSISNEKLGVSLVSIYGRRSSTLCLSDGQHHLIYEFGLNK